MSGNTLGFEQSNPDMVSCDRVLAIASKNSDAALVYVYLLKRTNEARKAHKGAGQEGNPWIAKSLQTIADDLKSISATRVRAGILCLEALGMVQKLPPAGISLDECSRSCQYRLQEPETVELTVDARLALASARDLCTWLLSMQVSPESKDFLMACIQAGQGIHQQNTLVASVSPNPSVFDQACKELIGCGIVQVEPLTHSPLGIGKKIRVGRKSNSTGPHVIAAKAYNKP